VQLSSYSSRLEMNIDQFTGLVFEEVGKFLNVRNKINIDPKLIKKALSYYQGVDAHMRMEYRRTNARFLRTQLVFEKMENDAISFARKESPPKATEKFIKQLAYETEEKLYGHRGELEDIEQKTKFLSGMVENVHSSLSAIQTLCNSMKDELGVAKQT